MQVFKDILKNIKRGEFSGEALDLTPDVCGEKLTDLEMIALADVLAVHPEIKIIDLSYNSITDKGVEAIAAVDTLEELDFSNILSGHDEVPNLITTVGAAALAKAKLKKLNLHNNPIGNEGIAALAFSETLLDLDVSECGVTGAGVSQFFSHNKRVLSLNLDSNELHSQCLEGVAMNHIIHTLNLSHCFIDASGAEFLSHNDSLARLDLACNDISTVGAEALARHPCLKVLNLSECQLDDNAMSGFVNNTTLINLCLSSNNITARGLEVLCQNQTLKVLNLDRNNIEFNRNLLSRLTHMSSLTYIAARDNRLNPELNEKSFLSCFDETTSIEKADFNSYCPSTQKTTLLFYNQKYHKTPRASTLEEQERSSEFSKRLRLE